jgi:hypothetical protein
VDTRAKRGYDESTKRHLLYSVALFARVRRGTTFIGRSRMKSSGMSMVRISSKNDSHVRGPVGKHHVAGLFVAVDEYLVAFETKFSREHRS